MSKEPKSSAIQILPEVKTDVTVKADSKDVADVTNRFMDRLSSASWTVYEPRHIKKKAKAEAEAILIKAEAEAIIPEIKRRAVERFIKQETRKQENLESITDTAKEMLEETGTPENIDGDWLAEFADRASNVSDEELQALWARILAGEANKPKSYRKSVLHTVSLLEKEDAEAFKTLCRFTYHIGTYDPIILDINSEIYTKHGIEFGTLMHLDDIGLIRFEPVGGLAKMGLPRECQINYGTYVYNIRFPEEPTKLSVGLVKFTHVGRQLFGLSEAIAIPELPQFLADEYKKKNIIMTGPGIKEEPSDEPPAN